ncbi:recombinase family protein [Mycobacterium marinum]|uniref:recombinase family protein n=1 Tax=Mycobacterium marinum TaxID=1781 RepID=UPI0019210143|nr:recombinase family protein [Mycobacterium marinum]QQW36519.1 recombinase family protein [Mycobacterium marinum]
MALPVYARVSTANQRIAGQVDVLEAADCKRVWTGTASSVRSQRQGFDQLMAAADCLTRESLSPKVCRSRRTLRCCLSDGSTLYRSLKGPKDQLPQGASF